MKKALLPDTETLRNPYGWRHHAIINKITDWAFIVILLVVTFILSHRDAAPFQQCIPGQDPECSDFVESPDPSIAYPDLDDTVPFSTAVVAGPVVWLVLLACNIGILHGYHSLFGPRQLWKLVCIKLEILLRSTLMCVSLTVVTTSIIKDNVGRPRPNYLSNEDMHEAVRSFPSGHTSHAFAEFTLLTLYLFNSLLSAQRLLNTAPRSSAAHRSISKPMAVYNNTGADDDDDIVLETTSDEQYDEILHRVDLLDSYLCNVLKMQKVTDPLNGDAYFFLWLFIRLRYCRTIALIWCLAPTLFAMYVGCSRLTDYKHHYSDVLAGALIGIGYAFVVYWYFQAEFYFGYEYNSSKIFQRRVDDKPLGSDML